MPQIATPQIPMQSLPTSGPQVPQQGVVGMPPANPEANMILKALISRLGLHNKAEEAKIPVVGR
jgi:hypothetical protein